jgi:ABC-type transport system involved in multi-copper enzyme maturation permease subunit
MEANLDAQIFKQNLQTMELPENRNNSFNKIISIARNTFREAVRDRVLYNLVLFVLLITVAAVFLGDLTNGHEARTIVNFGLSAMLLFGAFISIFVGVSLVSKEIEKRTVFAIFSKPIGRAEFIVGKYLGLCLTLLANVLVMGVGVSLALVYVGNGGLAFSIWGAIFLIFLELTILTATAILFSSFSSPALSALLTFFVFIIGHFSSSLRDLANSLGSAAAKFFFEFLYYVFPNLSHFSFIANAAHGDVPNGAMFGGATVYALVYVSILLVVTILIFSRRNFK